MSSGYDGFDQCVDLGDDYQVSMSDSWGDGWNGGALSIGDDSFTIDTGSSNDFLVGSCGLAGCTDENACGYNPDATFDDGSCYYVPAGMECDGSCSGGYMEVVLTAEDSYGDGWNGNVANVYFDGVLYDPAGVGFTYTLLATYKVVLVIMSRFLSVLIKQD